MNSIYDFKVKGLLGGEIDFAEFKGKKILIVNTASACGYTPQYRQLQELHENYGDKVAVIGFPSNDFGGQEPGDSAEIAAFCETNYHITFPLTSKVEIKGPVKHPVYQWLTSKALNGKQDSDVQWNFFKYLVDEKGNLEGIFPTPVEPLDEQILSKISG